MAVYSSHKVESSLQKKGFKKEPGDHNSFVLYDENGYRTNVWTKTSHNGQDINTYLQKEMARQTHLSKRDFANLIECPLSKKEYYKILREKNEI